MQGVVCNTSRMTGLEKRKIIADWLVWVVSSTSRLSDLGKRKIIADL